MKKNKYQVKSAMLVLLSGLSFFYGCKEEDQVFERTRLFQPVLSEDLYAEDNSIIVDMGNMKAATSYTIEVSRDTFKTDPLITMEVDTNFVIIPDLLWNAIYQVRAQAHADDAQYDSKVSDLGNVRTERYPSILTIPTADEVWEWDDRIRLSWQNAGVQVSTVKVFAPTDERLETPLAEYEISSEEIQEGEKIITGLESETGYQVAIYSGEELRGWENYFTKNPLPSGDNVINLGGFGSTALADTLPDIANGSIIILEGGVTYETGGYQFDKSVEIMSGYGWVPGGAIIDCSSNFNLSDGSNVDYVNFIGITFLGNFEANYVFNIDQSGTIGEIKFDNCRIGQLRGVTRVKGGTGSLEKFTIINSLIDSVQGYGILNIDTDGWTAGDILLKNSTFSHVVSFLVSKTNTSSVTIEDCTIFAVPEGGRPLLRWHSGTDLNITNGVKIYNTIVGPGWDMSGEGENTTFKGIDQLAGTNFDIVNTYGTADMVISGNEIPGFPSAEYSGSSTDLWEDPENGNFGIKDAGFAGKNDSGDTRWRPGI